MYINIHTPITYHCDSPYNVPHQWYFHMRITVVSTMETNLQDDGWDYTGTYCVKGVLFNAMDIGGTKTNQLNANYHHPSSGRPLTRVFTQLKPSCKQWTKTEWTSWLRLSRKLFFGCESRKGRNFSGRALWQIVARIFPNDTSFFSKLIPGNRHLVTVLSTICWKLFWQGRMMRYCAPNRLKKPFNEQTWQS